MTAAVAAALVVLPAAAGGAWTPLTAASPARSSANSSTFQDSTGEIPEAPDITSVVVSNTNAGFVTIQVNVPNRPSLTGDMLIGITLDSDNNPATGDQDPVGPGADYAIELFQGQVNLYRWDGTSFTRRGGDPPQASLVFSYARGATIRMNASELGNTKRFSFGVIVISGIVADPNSTDLDFSKARADIAPDAGHGLWNYQVRTAALRLVARRFRTDSPTAGRLFTARMAAARNDTGAVLAGGQVSCTATVGGRRLTARTHRFVNKEAVCGWQIPASARGQTIRGSIAVVFEGVRVRRSFARTIR
jgi:hypothetical protein